MKLRMKIWLIAGFVGLLTLSAFENCTGPSSNKNEKSAFSSENNAEGYTGKVYINADKDNSCQSTTIKNAIQQIGDQYFQTVKECQNIEPQNVTAEVQAKSYNTSVLFDANTLYEHLDAPDQVYSDVVCRGQATTPIDGQTPFADISLQPTGEFLPQPPPVPGLAPLPAQQIYKGYVKVGVYDGAGNLLQHEEFSIDRAVENPPAPPFPNIRNFTIYRTNGAPLPTDETYGLLVDENFTPASGNMLFKTQSMTQPLIVDHMDCYSH